LTGRVRGALRSVRASAFVRGALGSNEGRIGVILVILIVGLALLGPFFSPYSPTETVGLPFEPPSGSHWLGTEELGRDTLSRFLHGGATLIAVSFLATGLAYVIGIPFGLAAGYKRGAADHATSALADLLLVFPPIVFVLVVVAALGSGLVLVIVAIAVVHAPRVYRLVRAATLDISTQEYVEAAVGRHESVPSIVGREILPNIWPWIRTDFGVRFTGSVILFASLSYLGFGQSPPASNWGQMISENKQALLTQPVVVLVPAATIALLTIGVNLVAESLNRGAGRSVVGRGV
jgi:peptide/nickel transport system permease protein